MNTTYHRLTPAGREEISRGIWADETFSQIAQRIHFDTSSVSREIKKNVKRRRCYSAVKAQERADFIKKARDEKRSWKSMNF